MTIDRFEGEYAVIELDDKTFVNIPKIILPRNAKEGDVIEIKIDEDMTICKEKRLSDKLGKLFEN